MFAPSLSAVTGTRHPVQQAPATFYVCISIRQIPRSGFTGAQGYVCRCFWVITQLRSHAETPGRLFREWHSLLHPCQLWVLSMAAMVVCLIERKKNKNKTKRTNKKQSKANRKTPKPTQFIFQRKILKLTLMRAALVL